MYRSFQDLARHHVKPMWKVVINMMGIKELLSEVAEEIDAAEHELIWQLQHGDSKSFAAARKDLRYWQSRVAGLLPRCHLEIV
jgi:hypothetical protein